MLSSSCIAVFLIYIACVPQVPAGVDMCKAGDMADCLWVLHRGSVVAISAAEHNDKVIGAPALLGETALLQELDEQHLHRPCTLR